MAGKITAITVLAFLIFSGITCSHSTSPSTSTGGDAVLTGTPITYSTITGDSLGDTIIEITQQANRCTGGNLVAGRLDTVKDLYKFSGDSLLATNASLTRAYFLDVTLLNIKIWYVYTGGTHSGSTFSGAWALTGVKGEPSSAITDSIIAARAPSLLALGITFSATGTQIQTSSAITYADDFIALWNTVDSALYAVVVTKISNSMVTLTGDSTAYTATVWEDASGNINYSNTYSEYGPYTCYANPSACPNAARPVWWTQFLNANRK